ncbi:ThiF family protein [Chryseobacterium sp. 7]|uniref:ThiF family adenylyltransferase n=1 Tax=Chryseobacterium sp. 7 TaxID=2035214 RepID=UPI000EAC0383|nr:ThiF family adenylyltransferase [Chryseobacterium sp. 7]RLJ31176.1 ThiF family protein [Chryseobacterium sp. 7]
MSLQQINHSPDIRSLQDEGYEVEIKGGYICIHHIPYVNFEREIKYGVLFSPFQIIPGTERIGIPNDHVIHFIGEKPCHTNGNPILPLEYINEKRTLSKDLVADYSFSNKPQNPFRDFYEKFTSYIRVISNEAISLDETGTVTAKTFKPIIINETETPFIYFDSNSSRARIDFLNEKFLGMKVAIIGLGGTGSYILDFIAKTPVSQIHLFDNDTFESHNAFRAPGAASVDELSNRVSKVDYLKGIYSKMHAGLISHQEILSELNINELDNMDFVFICIDRNDARNFISKHLLSKNIPFIDSGLGINVRDERLWGATRITYNQQVGSEYNETSHNPYNSNIQIAELNAFNAVHAVMKWKQHCGFYGDSLNQNSSHFIIENFKFFHNAG